MSGYNIGGACLYSRSGKPLSASDVDLLTCPYCCLILRDPYQAIECGHRYCSSCIEKILSFSFPRCIVDEEEISRSQVRKDKGCIKELTNLLVDCPGSEFGCVWKGYLPDLESHMDDCEVMVLCQLGCGEYLLISGKEKHEKMECKKRLVTCHQCDQRIPVDQMEDHLSNCEMENCHLCNQFVSKLKMKEHTTTLCPELVVPCPVHGCEENGNLTTLHQHINKCHSFHMVKHINELKEKIKEKDKEIDGLRSTVQALCEDVKQLKQQASNLKPSMLLSQSTSFDPPSSTYSFDSGYNSSYASSVSSERSGGSSSLMPLLKAIEEKMHNEIEPNLHSLQQNMARVDEVAQTVQESVTRHAVSMEEIKLRQDILDVKTTTGLFVWKIPDIRKRFSDAAERRTLSLYSPPFHTSPHGYRMCIRVYLNGDGSGKGTHLSVFFVLMRSEHDSLLQWPFSRPVTFTLINQMFPSKSISETFLPDTRSPSFQQPRSEMNVASGFPRFAPQSRLHDESYTKGNCIFIKCRVDTQGLVCE